MSPQISLERLKRIRYLHPGAVQVILPDWFPVTMQEAIIFLQKMEEEAQGISLILYNPPHAKRQLQPEDWVVIKKSISSFSGLKVFDQNADSGWYKRVNANNMACLNPFMAQKWFEMIQTDLPASMEIESRINQFMSQLIAPFITELHYPNHACDRFMAQLGGWADVGSKLRWPYRSIPVGYIEAIRKESIKIIPEFFAKN